jgi:hypothetical protein
MALGACAVWSFLSYAGEDESSTNQGKLYIDHKTLAITDLSGLQHLAISLI